MYAHELISDAIPPVRTSDTIQKVMERMAEFRVNHLPIVNDLQFLGLISDEGLIESSVSYLSIGGLSLSLHNPFRFPGTAYI